MNFKNFIYFCALCGGWAAFLAWCFGEFLGLFNPNKFGGPEDGAIWRATFTASILGLFVASAIGLLDALLNSVGFQRIIRSGVCLGVGMVGGLLGGMVGGYFTKQFGGAIWQVLGWCLVGIIIGASIGVYDLQRAILAKQPLGMARRKILNGVIGGAVGGVLGGIFFVLEALAFKTFNVFNLDVPKMWSPRAVGLVILGACIGLLIGTAQVILKEAWVKIEAGFRAGREIMLTKPETTAGRAESCDIGLFGDPGIEKLHARIVLQAGRYMLVDNGTPGGTFLNGDKISKPTPLRSGDLIQIGKSSLRFGERRKSH